MKKILLTLLALLTVAPLLAQSDTLALGYCKGAVASEGMATQKGNTWVSAAIQLPGETMEAYQGNSVAQVRVALCSRSNIDTLRVWVRKTLKGENLAEGYITMKTDTRIKKGWNVVELNAPYAITGERLYIGFDLKQRGSTPALSVVKPGQTGSFHYKSTSDAFWGDRHGQGAISVEAVIVGNNLPKYDLALTGAKAMLNATTGSVTMSGTVFNKATRPVNKFTITTTVAGQKFATTFDKTITSGQYIDLKWTINPTLGSVDGESAVNVNITDLGGETDIDPTNNALDIAMGFKRKVLLEEFTTESCPNCPRVAGYLHTALENPEYEGEVFAAAHHVMYYTDWLTTKRSVVNGEYIKTDLYEYASLYNDRGTYAPAMMFGRNAWFDAMSTAGNKCCTYMPGSAMEIESLIQQIQSDPANIIITNLSARYGDNDTTIVVRVEGMRNSSAKDGSRITVMLTEDNIAAHGQMGAEGSFTHQHVTRAINSVWGEPIEWDGNKFSYEVSLGLNTVYFTKNDKVQAGNFEEAWRMWNRDNLNIVAFVNYYSTNVEGCAVENVEGAKFNDAINGIEDLPQTKESQTVRSEVYTIDGKRIEADQMGRGLYIIRDIQADGSVHTRKVMRKKILTVSGSRNATLPPAGDRPSLCWRFSFAQSRGRPAAQTPALSFARSTVPPLRELPPLACKTAQKYHSFRKTMTFNTQSADKQRKIINFASIMRNDHDQEDHLHHIYAHPLGQLPGVCPRRQGQWRQPNHCHTLAAGRRQVLRPAALYGLDEELSRRPPHRRAPGL